MTRDVIYGRSQKCFVFFNRKNQKQLEKERFVELCAKYIKREMSFHRQGKGITISAFGVRPFVKEEIKYNYERETKGPKYQSFACKVTRTWHPKL
ncbi:hypothetical protein POTOM_004139 [Populus tomentosa]|uniref:Uncharacterized protein n=1 Tax=Populus tomentosa TaxID=118781 RepID=A0A8X8AGS9_POPTO|nr:hypothetical protein POTOM_004139 [Populus tomentosa]